MKNEPNGFTLLELLITLSIVGILAAIIYPSYQSHLLKAHRSQAKIALIDWAAKLEQYHIAHGSYAEETLTPIQTDYYRFKMQIAPETYTLYAVPRKQQTKDPCGTLSYNQAGEKTSGGKINDCW